jgi:hypothetical protein
MGWFLSLRSGCYLASIFLFTRGHDLWMSL